MHRASLRRAAAVGVLIPRSGFEVSDFVHASEFVGCEGASPTPQVQFQVLSRTSSSGKGRQFLSVRKLTLITLKLIT